MCFGGPRSYWNTKKNMIYKKSLVVFDIYADTPLSSKRRLKGPFFCWCSHSHWVCTGFQVNWASDSWALWLNCLSQKQTHRPQWQWDGGSCLNQLVKPIMRFFTQRIFSVLSNIIVFVWFQLERASLTILTFKTSTTSTYLKVTSIEMKAKKTFHHIWIFIVVLKFRYLHVVH